MYPYDTRQETKESIAINNDKKTRNGKATRTLRKQRPTWLVTALQANETHDSLAGTRHLPVGGKPQGCPPRCPNTPVPRPRRSAGYHHLGGQEPCASREINRDLALERTGGVGHKAGIFGIIARFARNPAATVVLVLLVGVMAEVRRGAAGCVERKRLRGGDDG